MGEIISVPEFPLGAIKDVRFSFQDPLVFAHFQFASFILGLLARINEIIQVKYGFVNDFWQYLVSLDDFLKREIRKIQDCDFTSFPYLAAIGQENHPQFVSILKHLCLNISVRFTSICSSLDKKKIKRHLDYEQMIIHPCAAVNDHPRCGVSPFLHVFYLKNHLFRAHHPMCFLNPELKQNGHS